MDGLTASWLQTIIESKAVIRGDLALITIGQCSLIGENSVIRPPDHRFKGYALRFLPVLLTFFLSLSILCGGSAVHFLQVTIGDHTTIEKDWCCC